MNEQLQKALVEILESVLSAKVFLTAELPDVISQLLVWNMSMSILETVLGIFILWTIYFATKKYANNWDKIYQKDLDATIVLMGIYDIVMGVAGFCLLFNLKWLQIWLAPKIYLLEYAANLAK